MEPIPDQVVVLAYDGVAADEAGIVVAILADAGLPITIASVAAAATTSYHGRLLPTLAVTDVGPCAALLVPGGMGVRQVARSQLLVTAIAELAGQATWLAATSTGSVLLAAAGVIDGARATTHWLARELLLEWGLVPVDEPFVEHGRLLTASGQASAAALAFRLVGAIGGVALEAEARGHYQPRPLPDPRYRPRLPFWRTLGRKRASPVVDQLDASGRADVVVLDLAPLER